LGVALTGEALDAAPATLGTVISYKQNYSFYGMQICTWKLINAFS